MAIKEKHCLWLSTLITPWRLFHSSLIIFNTTTNNNNSNSIIANNFSDINRLLVNKKVPQTLQEKIIAEKRRKKGGEKGMTETKSGKVNIQVSPAVTRVAVTMADAVKGTSNNLSLDSNAFPACSKLNTSNHSTMIKAEAKTARSTVTSTISNNNYYYYSANSASLFFENEEKSTAVESTMQHTKGSVNIGSTSKHSPEECERLKALLFSLKQIINRPLPIGDLYKKLSLENKKLLYSFSLSLEEFLLHFEHFFNIYSHGKGSRAKPSILYAAPPFLVPKDAKVKQILKKNDTVSLLLLSENGGIATGSNSTFNNSDEVLRKIMEYENSQGGFDSAPLTSAEKVEEILKYIPNEFTYFSEIDIPLNKKMKYMGYPSTKSLEFFRNNASFFDMMAQGKSEPSFKVRRSKALQEKLKKMFPDAQQY